MLLISKHLPKLLALTIFMQMLDTTILNTALPKMALDLRQSPLQMQSAIIAYTLTLALLMPLSAYFCDRFGTKRVFLWSLLLFVLGSVACAFAPSLAWLVSGRVLQGMGGAMLTAAPRLVMVKSYDKNQLLTMINYIVTPALIGPIIGPILGGYLSEYMSWHWIFWINVPVGVVAMWLTWRIMPDFRADKLPELDKLGFLLFGGGAVALSLAMEWASYPNRQMFALILLMISVLAFVAYIYHAKRTANPLYSLNLRLVRTFRIGVLGNLVSRLGISAMPFLLPLLLQVGLGNSASVAGLALAPVAMAAIVGKSLVQPIMRRWGYRRVLSWNTRLIGLMIMSFALPNADTPVWALLPQLFVMGLCNSIQFSGMNSITVADLRAEQNSSGTSFMAVNQQLAIGMGVALSALVLQQFSQHSLHIHDAFRWTFVLMGCFTFASSWIFARLHGQDGANLLR
ncbi:DHA2 family efflux MFS transporter permease subunit [Alysiella crassa]|uniref:High-copy suppressor of rspA n=1 Tax=Alysiella crassa TaxID=153491 RepID=A0A376BLR7_9NEIS|nr:DHA2 family efflux MFS transporter permease subunit [Alysiella crassa]SSY70164.1 High-copy suppressor of rspA [Alysiella crassa]